MEDIMRRSSISGIDDDDDDDDDEREESSLSELSEVSELAAVQWIGPNRSVNAPTDEGATEEGIGGVWIDVHVDKVSAVNVEMTAAWGAWGGCDFGSLKRVKISCRNWEVNIASFLESGIILG
jgi:hypothetical protein